MKMLFNIMKRIIISNQPRTLNRISSKFYSIYEPDYLEATKAKYPIYPPLTVQIRGYDYAILENYQKWIHKIAEAMDFDVDNSYPMPAKEFRVVRFKPNSKIIDAEYFLNMYNRHINISNVASVRLPIFIRIVEAAIPIGVQLDIEEWSEEVEKLRYVPDKHLLDLREELNEMKK